MRLYLFKQECYFIRKRRPMSHGYSFEDLLALLHGHAPAKVAAVARHRRRVEHGYLFFWTDDKPPEGFVPCPCGWAGLPHYAREDHVQAYRDDPKRYQRRAKYQEAGNGLGSGPHKWG
jgi:hypothetical protein